MHADLHKGNWKVKISDSKDNDDFKIVLYDFGFCFRLNPNHLNNLWLGWETLNKELLAITFVDIIKEDNKNLCQKNVYNKVT